MSGRILIIDSDVEHLERLSAMLEARSHEVIRATDGEEGVRRFHAELPDLVFLELLLPRRDGSEVCSEIKQSDHGLITPVVVLTAGYKGQNKLAFMRTYGVLDFLTKPVAPDKIFALVDWALSKQDSDACVDDPVLDRITITDSQEGGESAPLANDGIVKLMNRAWQESFTGLLVASRGRQRKAIGFHQGRIIGIRSNAPAERLDRIILAMRLATPGQMAIHRGRSDGDADALVADLTAHGVLNDKLVQEVIGYQALMAGMSLLSWRDGVAQFLPDAGIECLRLSRPIHPARLVLAGLRRNPWLLQPHEERLAGTLLLRRSRAEPPQFADLVLTRLEQLMLSLVDGARDVRALRELGDLAQIKVDRALAILTAAGLIEPEPASSEHTAMEPSSCSASGTFRTGTLSRHPLVEVLGALARERATGTLTIQHLHTLNFHFVDGELVGATSSRKADRLGQVLLENRVVNQSSLDRALAEQAVRPGLRLGSLMVERGDLSLAQLERALKILTLCILDQALEATVGDFSFEPREPIGWVVRTGLSHYDILRRGARLLSDTYFRERWCDGPQQAVIVVDSGATPAGLSDEERDLLELLRPEGAVEDLPGLELADPPVLRTVQFLIAAGVARIEERPRPERPAEPAEDDVETLEIELLPEAPAAPAEPPPLSASMTTLEVTASESARGFQADGSVTALLDFLRDTLFAEKREAETRVRVLCEELGHLRERIKHLESEKDAQSTAPPPTSKPKVRGTDARSPEIRRPRARATKGKAAAPKVELVGAVSED